MSSRQFLKRNIFILILGILPLALLSQTADPYPYASDVVKFDIITLRTDKALPFDKPFVLVVENINTESIIRASIYRCKYERGNRILFPDKKDVSYADYLFEQKQMVIEKNKLTLLVPPLRPAKDFDILIEKKLSGRNLDKAHVLNKIIIDNNIQPPVRGGSINWPQNAIDAFKLLRDSANNSNFKPPRDVFTVTDPDDYYNNVFLLFEINYRNIIDDTKFKRVGGTFIYLTDPELAIIAANGPANMRPFHDVSILEQVEKESTFNELLLGLRPLGYSHGSKLTDRDEFEKRVGNFTSSIQLFDSLYRTMNEMTAKNAALGTKRDHVLEILKTLQANKKVLTDNMKAITTILSDYKEAVWLIGTTQTKDLQTKSSSIFTLDAGFANIWARDLSNKNVYIPKLFWSVNIFFRGTDKNIRSRYIPKKRKAQKIASGSDSIYCDFDLLTHKTPFNQLCLNIGFTFGSLDKQNFDNFFAGSSMLVGPSLRLTRSFRLSGGVIFLKRANLNPVLSDRKITTGAYASLSLDFDILNALKNVSSMFFK